MDDVKLAEYSRVLSDYGKKLDALLAPTFSALNKTMNQFYARYFPSEHRQMMLREARRRARLSTQRRRHS